MQAALGLKAAIADGEQAQGTFGVPIRAQAQAITITGQDPALRVDPAFVVPGFLRRQAEKQIVSNALRGLKKRAESD